MPEETSEQATDRLVLEAVVSAAHGRANDIARTARNQAVTFESIVNQFAECRKTARVLASSIHLFTTEPAFKVQDLLDAYNDFMAADAANFPPKEN